MIEVQNGHPHPRVREAVLFPFDEASIPFTSGLRLHMVSSRASGREALVVLPGPAGAPDDMRVRFYGAVIPSGDELRMWYMGAGSRDGYRADRLCYAVSRDGVHWEKPALGLVEYNGSTQNNLVALRNGALRSALRAHTLRPGRPGPAAAVQGRLRMPASTRSSCPWPSVPTACAGPSRRIIRSDRCSR